MISIQYRMFFMYIVHLDWLSFDNSFTYFSSLFHLPSENVQRLFQSYHPHTKRETTVKSNDFKYGRCYQSNLNTFDKIIPTMQSSPLRMTTGSWPTFHGWNLKGWHLLMIYQSNITKWRSLSKLCSSSRNYQHTHYIQLFHNYRPTTSPSN